MSATTASKMAIPESKTVQPEYALVPFWPDGEEWCRYYYFVLRTAANDKALEEMRTQINKYADVPGTKKIAKWETVGEKDLNAFVRGIRAASMLVLLDAYCGAVTQEFQPPKDKWPVENWYWNVHAQVSTWLLQTI